MSEEIKRENLAKANVATAVAYHEAGHAVASEFLGIPVDMGVNVVVVHFLQVSGKTRSSTLSSSEVNLIVDVAGQVAEKLAGYRHLYNWRGQGRDGIVSDGERVRKTGRDQRAKAIARAEAILQANWASVQALTAALLDGVRERGCCGLHRERILRLISNVGGLRNPDA